MGKLVVGAALLLFALILRSVAVSVGDGRPAGGVLLRRLAPLTALGGLLLMLLSAVTVIDAGTVGVQHYFGYVNPHPLLPGIRFVYPWSSVLEVLHDMRASSNLVVLVPTEGGLPVLNLGELRRNLRQP